MYMHRFSRVLEKKVTTVGAALSVYVSFFIKNSKIRKQHAQK